MARMSEHTETQVTENAEARRFEAHIDGALAGFADYRDDEAVRSFVHTEVDPSFGGRGVGSTLVDEALRATIAEGKQIRPICSFVVARSAADEFAAHVVH